MNQRELDIEPVADLEIEPDDIDEAMPTLASAPAPETRQLSPLMDVLPADFPLPTLVRFVADIRLRDAAADATAYALAVDVTGPEGLQRGDLALTTLRTSLKAIDAHFAEPVDIAHQLHKRLTGLRGAWTEAGEAALKTVGRRLSAEMERLRAEEAAKRRKTQEEADRLAREAAQKEAAAAAKAKAPAPVVRELERRAETATAAPVPVVSTAPVLQGVSAVTTWKSRPQGTPADAEPNPKIAEMTPGQIARVRDLLTDILADKAPISAIEINYSVLNARAKSDKSTFRIAGFEAFPDGGLRAKARRG